MSLSVGTDVKTIHEAIKIAQPGDTIHLEPIVYRDCAGVYGKKSEAGKPITLDGHGATLEGSVRSIPRSARKCRWDFLRTTICCRRVISTTR
ncbi:MAG: hypothetical protein NTV08_17615 [Verrucomicrobia bacterium]|nr:hypothetical protein [Verrucomicrobiota bacterium]